MRLLRKQRDYTQDNMASELAITPGAYAKIERGETDPSVTRLQKIAEILGVDITYFFAGSIGSSDIIEQSSRQPYDFASKTELEQLAQLVKQLGREMENLKQQLHAKKRKKGGG